MMIQGAALGAIAATILALTIALGFCVNDNLNVRDNYSQLVSKVEAANKEAKRRKQEIENASIRTQEESDARFNAMRNSLTARLNIMHNDRNEWLNRHYPEAGTEAAGLPPVCFDYGEFNRSQRESEEEAARISDKGEEHRLNLIEARDWASRQPFDKPVVKKEKKSGNLILEFIN